MSFGAGENDQTVLLNIVDIYRFLYITCLLQFAPNTPPLCYSKCFSVLLFFLRQMRNRVFTQKKRGSVLYLIKTCSVFSVVVVSVCCCCMLCCYLAIIKAMVWGMTSSKTTCSVIVWYLL